MPSCDVCGCPQANQNYGALACNRCRVFFYRCIKFEEPPTCQYVGKCEITNVKRGNCPACRFQRCLHVNMDRNEVCRRGYRNKVSEMFLSQKAEAMQFFHPLMVARNPVNVPGSLETIEMCQRLSLNMFSISPTYTTHSCHNISIEELLNDQSRCSSRETACIDNIHSVRKNSQVHYNFIRSYCRWITSFIDLLDSTHFFRQLPLIDQIKMIQHNASHYLTFIALWDRLKCGESNQKWQKHTHRFKPDERMSELLHKRMEMWNIMIGKIGGNFMEMDELEFIASLVITIFSAPCGLSQNGLKIVIFAKEAYSLKLSEYIRNTRPELNRTDQLERLRMILESGLVIKNCTGFINYFYREMIFNDHGGIAGLLPYEIHIKEFR